MKRISQILRYALLTTMLAASGSVCAAGYFVYGDQNYDHLSDLTHYIAASTDGNVHTATINNCSSGRYFIGYSSSTSSDDITATSEPGFSSWDGTSDHGPHCENGKCYIYFNLSSQKDITISYNSSTNTYTLSASSGSFSVTVNVTGGTISGIGSSSHTYDVASSQSLTITPTSALYGYVGNSVSSGTATVDASSRPTFTITPSSNCTVNITYATCSVTATAGVGGSITSSATQSVAYGGSLYFTYSEDSGYALDFSNCSFSGSGSLSNPSSGTITVSGITSGGDLSVAFRSTASSSLVVYYGSYPTQENNTVSLSGFLADKSCSETVSAAGFYYGTSISAVEAHSSSIAATTPASVASIDKGSVFSATKSDFDYTTGTYIYFQAYVTTDLGTGYSDIVGFFYNPCVGVSTPTIAPSSVSLADGFSQTFSVVARNAGKHPKYVWKLDDVVIDGAITDTYTYTSDGSNHTLTVEVTGNCEQTESENASITSCTAPTITSFTFSPTAPSDWEDVTLSVGGTNINASEWEWSVDSGTDGEAAISNTTSTSTSASAIFRAKDTISGETAKAYYVTYTAKGACTGDVKVSQTIQIDVNTPSEICNP